MGLLFAGLLVAMAIGMPIAFAFGITSALFIYLTEILPITTVAQRMGSALETWPLLAIPFFMLMGDIFMRGGMGNRLLNLVSAAVGSVPGGLGVVCVVVNMFMAGVSGSALADASAIGSVLIPEMVKKGFPKDFVVALHSTSAVIGIIIPPSIPMIIYAYITESSVRAMFLGGMIPGILIGLGLITLVVWTSWREGYPRERWGGWPAFLRQFWPNLWAFLAPVVVLGGILGGIVTATESAAIGCAYVLIVELFIYKQLKWRDYVGIFANAAKMTAAAMFVVGTASVYASIFAYLDFAQLVGGWLTPLLAHGVVFLLMLNIYYLIQGCFMDLLPGMLLTVPIFLPLALRLGMDPIHFGVMLVINLGIGLFTPPVGVVLFTVCSMANLSMEAAAKRIVPFIIPMIIVLMMVAFIPGLSLWMGTMAR